MLNSAMPAMPCAAILATGTDAGIKGAAPGLDGKCAENGGFAAILAAEDGAMPTALPPLSGPQPSAAAILPSMDAAAGIAGPGNTLPANRQEPAAGFAPFAAILPALTGPHAEVPAEFMPQSQDEAAVSAAPPRAPSPESLPAAALSALAALRPRAATKGSDDASSKVAGKMPKNPRDPSEDEGEALPADPAGSVNSLVAPTPAPVTPLKPAMPQPQADPASTSGVTSKAPLLPAKAAAIATPPAAAPAPAPRPEAVPTLVLRTAQPDLINGGGGNAAAADPLASLAMPDIAAIPSPLAPTPLNNALLQPVTLPGLVGNAPALAAERPLDFAALVDRIAAARDLAAPASLGGALSISLPHADFGKIDLTFDANGDALKVALSSPDPEFSRAVREAAPRLNADGSAVLPMVGANQPTATGNNAASGNGTGSQHNQNPAGQGNAAFAGGQPAPQGQGGQSQSPRGPVDPRLTRGPDGQPAPSTTKAKPDAGDGAIYA